MRTDKWWEPVGGILGVIVSLFTVLQVVTEEPRIALIVALFGAVFASWYFVRKGYRIDTIILAWLIAVVIGLLIFIFFPRSITIAGIVYDAKGSLVSNAEVTLTDAKGFERRTRTDKDGRYRFEEVPIGEIEVRAGDGRSNVQINNPLTGIVTIDIRSTQLVIDLTSAPSAPPVPPPPATSTPTLIPITNTPTPSISSTSVSSASTATNTPEPTVPSGYSKLSQAINNANFGPQGPGDVKLSEGQLYQVIECQARCQIRVLPGPAEVWVSREQIGLPPGEPTVPPGYSRLPQAINNANFGPQGPGDVKLSEGQLYQVIECQARCRIRVLPGPAEVWVSREQIGLSPASLAPTPLKPTQPTNLPTPLPTSMLTLTPTLTPTPSATLTPTPSPVIRVQVNVNVEGRWMGWRTDPSTDNNYAGTIDQAKRILAIRIRLVGAPQDMQVCYAVHIEDIGATPEFCDGDIAGMPEQGRRIEALSIRLINAPFGLHIRYKAYVQDLRWMAWQCDGDLAGTTGQAKRMEALKVRIASAEECS